MFAQAIFGKPKPKPFILTEIAMNDILESLGLPEIDRFIGDGGFGAVYSLEGGEMAVKLGDITAYDVDGAILASLDNIGPTIFAHGRVDDTTGYIVMERLSTTLSNTETLTRADVESLVQLYHKCMASFAGHGDLHDGNVMARIRPDGTREWLLIDWEFNYKSSIYRDEFWIYKEWEELFEKDVIPKIADAKTRKYAKRALK